MDVQKTIDSARAGDRRAFDRLVSGYRDMALGYANSIVGDSDLAEDAVQEALVVAHRSLDRLAESEAFAAWLRGIVRHRCLRPRRAESPLQEDSLSATALGAEETGQVSAAVARLPESLRLVVQLHYADGLSQAEIASQLRISRGTVNMRLHSARARLRRRLIMLNEPTLTAKYGHVTASNGPLVALRFHPESTPFIFGRLVSDRNELCVVHALPDGTVHAVDPSASGIWTPGREVADTGERFDVPLPDSVAVATALGWKSNPIGELPTGIKTIDIFAPLAEGGRCGIFAEWGVGTLVLLPELVRRLESGGKNHAFFAFMPVPRNDKEWREINAEVAVGTKKLDVVYLPVEDPLTPEFREKLHGLEARIVLSRYLAEQGIWPCIDPLLSDSNQPHQGLAEGVRAILRDYYRLQSPLAAATQRLTAEDWETVRRARLAMRFLSQPFFVAEPFTGMRGADADSVVALETLADILEGKYDEADKERFFMTGDRPKA